MSSLHEVLGLPQFIEEFVDGAKRKLYPVTMDKFADFMVHFSNINYSKLWTNFLFEDKTIALKSIFTVSFPDDDVEVIFQNINANNYVTIMDKIMEANGIDINKDDEPKNKVGV